MSIEINQQDDYGMHFEEAIWGVKVIFDPIILDDSNFLDYIKRILDRIRQSEASLILMDSRKAIRNVSTFKMFDALVNNDYSASIGRRIAVISALDTDADGSQFIEDICSNRGIEINYFVEESKALEWLLRDQGGMIDTGIKSAL